MSAAPNSGIELGGPSAKANPHTTIARRAPIFSTMRKLCTALPARTPKQFTTVSSATASAASALSESGTGTSSRKYRANAMAVAAIPPLWMTSKSAQPYRNAASGLYASRR